MRALPKFLALLAGGLLLAFLGGTEPAQADGRGKHHLHHGHHHDGYFDHRHDRRHLKRTHRKAHKKAKRHRRHALRRFLDHGAFFEPYRHGRRVLPYRAKRAYTWGCQQVTRIGRHRGRKALFAGTVCHDAYGRPYFVPGSRYVIGYLSR